MISQPEPLMMPELQVGGKRRVAEALPYINTERCMKAFNTMSCDARYLGLINAEDLIDRRNAEPIIYLPSEEEDNAALATRGQFICEPVNLEIPHLTVIAPVIRQRYHIEIWAEKTTMNDVLLPLCQQYGINLITGMGELSYTRCLGAVARAGRSELPLRILYLSDFDPGGLSMPTAVARKIEFELRTKEHDLDIQVRPILLTPEQCVYYELPRIPLKDTETRKAVFEKRFGEGATELDALEALHPSELARLLTKEILRYYDTGLERRIQNKVADVEEELKPINAGVRRKFRKELAKLKAARKKEDTRANAFKKKWSPTLAKIKKALNAAAPDLSQTKWPEPKPGDEDPDPLFDSTRDYLTQVDRFKRHQAKPTARKKSAPRKKFKVICANPNCPLPRREFEATQKSAKCCCSSCRNALRLMGPKRVRRKYLRGKALAAEIARTGTNPNAYQKPEEQKCVECGDPFTVLRPSRNFKGLCSARCRERQKRRLQKQQANAWHSPTA
jgi:hypothetical protein